MSAAKYSNIYVGCPANNKTGGTELAHQLVKQINNDGGCAFIFYYDFDGSGDPINSQFRKYVSTYATIETVRDEKSSAVILPEICISLSKKFRNAKVMIWWMSVDNFVKRNGFINSCSFYGLWGSIKNVIKRRISLLPQRIDNTLIHLYQSEYAKQFLKAQGISNCYRLSDYINDSYLNIQKSCMRQKENIVLYNPKKGFQFTKKLIEKSQDLNWIPIQNLSTTEVKELLLRSKVYIDFGNHPGKDRFPREAAASYCIVITGKRGSANYSQDLPIKNVYKFNDNEQEIENIIAKIRECILNYEDIINDFEDYREMINEEKKLFADDVKEIFFTKG